MFPFACPLVIDGRFRLHALAWALVALVGYGMVSAIIPNPVFGRQITPEAFAIAVWLLSSPLIGIVGATYTAPMPAAVARPIAFAPMAPIASAGPLQAIEPVAPGEERRSSTLGTRSDTGGRFAPDPGVPQARPRLGLHARRRP